MKTVYMVHGGDVYGDILFGIYTDRETAVARQDKLTYQRMSYYTGEIEKNGGKNTKHPYYGYYTAAEMLERIREYYKVDAINLDIDTEIELYIE